MSNIRERGKRRKKQQSERNQKNKQQTKTHNENSIKNQKGFFSFNIPATSGAGRIHPSALKTCVSIYLHKHVSPLPNPDSCDLPLAPTLLQRSSPPKPLTSMSRCLQREAECAVSPLVSLKKRSARQDWVAPALQGAHEKKAGVSGPWFLRWR